MKISMNLNRDMDWYEWKGLQKIHVEFPWTSTKAFKESYNVAKSDRLIYFKPSKKSVIPN